MKNIIIEQIFTAMPKYTKIINIYTYSSISNQPKTFSAVFSVCEIKNHWEYNRCNEFLLKVFFSNAKMINLVISCQQEDKNNLCDQISGLLQSCLSFIMNDFQIISNPTVYHIRAYQLALWIIWSKMFKS